MASIFSWHHFTFQRQPSVLITSHKLTKPSFFQRCSYSSLYWQIAFIFHITLSILQYQDTPVVSWHIVPTLATNLCRLLATSLSVLWLLDTPTATLWALTSCFDTYRQPLLDTSSWYVTVLPLQDTHPIATPFIHLTSPSCCNWTHIHQHTICVAHWCHQFHTPTTPHYLMPVYMPVSESWFYR
jgi:hypothetical protein